MPISVDKYGQWAVVAGASEGLGAAFATKFAELGFNVVLIARTSDKLDRTKQAISAASDVELRIIQADLSINEDLELIMQQCESLDIGMFVYNAAYSVIKPFLSQSMEDHNKSIEVNCTSLTKLLYHFANRLRKQGRGGIILMSSMSSLQGSPLIATYAASKAYIRILGESLWYELKDSGVDVLVCCAGATSTPNFIKSKPEKQSKLAPPVMKAREVVDEALSNLGRKPFLIPGRANRIANAFMRLFMSNKKAVKVMGDTMYNMYPQNKDGQA